jgi:predicted ATP-grasp superfamily ATP-dependent carboligase
MPRCHKPAPAGGANLICVGASVRGLARSAARAGWRIHAADLFGDRDLRDVVASFAAAGGGPTPYPDHLATAVAAFPEGPWCYTGALENHPDLVDRIAAARRLAGNAGRALRAVRDPAVLGPAVRAAGLDYPATFATPDGLPTDGSFLLKPRASAGGRGIVPWRAADPPGRLDAHVWQRHVAGKAWAAAFVCTPPSARCWGVTRQLVGRGWCHARAFAYCGSIEVPPAHVPRALAAACARLSRALVDVFGLVGLVGVDLVIDAAGRVHVIEVNPRPSASMELTERSTGVPHAAVHLAACGVAAAPPRRSDGAAAGTWGKAVLFAAHDTRIDPAVDAALGAAALRWSRADGWPALADLPPPGTRVAAGRPLLTLFARATDGVATARALRRRAAALDRLLRARSSAGEPAGD